MLEKNKNVDKISFRRMFYNLRQLVVYAILSIIKLRLGRGNGIPYYRY